LPDLFERGISTRAFEVQGENPMNASLVIERTGRPEAYSAFAGASRGSESITRLEFLDEFDEPNRDEKPFVFNGTASQTSPSSPDPVHERFGDDALRLINPFLRCRSAPTIEEFDRLMAGHRFRSARPGGVNYRRALESVARFCFFRGGSWEELGAELNKRVSGE